LMGINSAAIKLVTPINSENIAPQYAVLGEFNMLSDMVNPIIILKTNELNGCGMGHSLNSS
ncbi:hypothetical protein GASC598B02_003860, partial [Gilliamella apicola SCGC AB-598-B02]